MVRVRPCRPPWPQASLSSGASRTTAKDRTGEPGCPVHQSDEQSQHPDNGHYGRRLAKRAVIRTARSARTLSAICP